MGIAVGVGMEVGLGVGVGGDEQAANARRTIATTMDPTLRLDIISAFWH